MSAYEGRCILCSPSGRLQKKKSPHLFLLETRGLDLPSNLNKEPKEHSVKNIRDTD